MKTKVRRFFKYLIELNRKSYDRSSFIESREPLGIMLSILGVSR